MVTERIASGIKGLDQIACGGFIPNRAYLIRGGPGSGKTTLGTHFLCEGMLNNENTLFITLVESESKIKEDAEKRGIKLGGVYFLDLSFSSENITGEEVYNIFYTSEVEQKPLFDKITEKIYNIKPYRIFLDCVTFNKSERTPGDSNFYDCISSYKDDLYKMKEKSSPVLLPVLLIFSSGNAKEINEGYYLDDLIDEIIKIPVEKRELSIRIRSLLKHRELSREAKILTEKSPVGICVLQQGKMIFVNPYFCSILGRERDEMINKNFLDVILPEDRYLVQKQLEEITEVNDVSLEVGGIKSTGKCLMDLKFSLAPYRGDNAVLVIAIDITERRKAEEI